MEASKMQRKSSWVRGNSKEPRKYDDEFENANDESPGVAWRPENVCDDKFENACDKSPGLFKHPGGSKVCDKFPGVVKTAGVSKTQR